MTTFRLAIFHDVTDDNCDNSPWPPDGDDNWAVVQRMNGRTRWRRIALEADSGPLLELIDNARRTPLATRAEFHHGRQNNVKRNIKQNIKRKAN
jgi:hypothetical protein